MEEQAQTSAARNEEDGLAEARARIKTRRREIASAFRQLTDDPLLSQKLAPAEYIRVLYGIAHQTATAYEQLWEAGLKSNAMYAAYNVRNLLELVVWAEYCCMCVENGLRFFQDSARDRGGMYIAVRELISVSDHHVTSRPDIGEFLAQYAALSEAQRREATDKKFLRVGEAAKALGSLVEVPFKSINTFLSKLVHPSAFVVTNAFYPQWDDKAADAMIAPIFSMGVSFADAIFTRLLVKAKSLAPK